jgi:hypothetical protein
MIESAARAMERVQFHIGVVNTEDGFRALRILCGTLDPQHVISEKYAVQLDGEDCCPACRVELDRLRSA